MNFWETEKPMSVDTGKNIIEYFPGAKSLSVSKPNWTDKKTGEVKRGKTVLLDLVAVANSPEAVKLLTRVLTELNKIERK